MKVINIHKRLIHQPQESITKLLETLSSSRDKVWPNNNWPAMRFKNGLVLGSKGGHGHIRYTVIDSSPNGSIKFEFTRPHGFKGTHELLVNEIANNTSEIMHIIDMRTTTIKATLSWMFVIRWLHDALIEDAFDNVENQFSAERKRTSYNLWVKLLRAFYKRKSFQVKQV